MQVSNSSVARPWKLEQNPLGQALKGNWSKIKKGPFCGPQNVRKSRRAKMGLPCSSFHLQLLLVKSASTWNKRFKNICHNEGAKNWTLQGDHFWFQEGPLSWQLFNYVSFARRSKTGLSIDWIRHLLGGSVERIQAPSSAALFQCWNTWNQAELAIRTCFSWWKRSHISKACNRGASRARRGQARPGRGHACKTYWHKTKQGLRGLETI